MKRSMLWASLVALVLTAASAQFRLQAQSQTPPSAAQQEPQQGQARTFVGQIVQAKNGQYALLVDKNAGTGFYLDNPEKAKKYTGQKVKVTGTLNAQTKTIQITEIQPMA